MQFSKNVVNLFQVCGITEMLMSNKQYKNCSFKLTLNDKEATEYKFSAEVHICLYF